MRSSSKNFAGTMADGLQFEPSERLLRANGESRERGVPRLPWVAGAWYSLGVAAGRPVGGRGLRAPYFTRPEAGGACVHHGATEGDRGLRERSKPHGVSRHHARSSGGGGPFRTPDPPLESEDEAVHLPRAERHLHHRPVADTGDAQSRVRLGQADVA